MVPNYSLAILFGWGGCNTGATLKTATGHFYWLQTFVRRDGSVSKEPDGHSDWRLAALEVMLGCLTKTGVVGGNNG